eukprot:SAG31_NODE_1738_length_7402_cov_14.270163_3_plen_180_part_00
MQGSGKSHTAAVVLENCVLPCHAPTASPIVQLLQPMAALALHYDPAGHKPCEATGIVETNPALERALLHATSVVPQGLELPRVTVLVPRSVFAQRTSFYTEMAGGTVTLPKSWLLTMPPAERQRAVKAAARQATKFTVQPLLFRWKSLSVGQVCERSTAEATESWWHNMQLQQLHLMFP